MPQPQELKPNLLPFHAIGNGKTKRRKRIIGGITDEELKLLTEVEARQLALELVSRARRGWRMRPRRR